MTDVAQSVRCGAVVVDYDTGEVIVACLRSLIADGIELPVVVENGDAPAARRTLANNGLAPPLVVTGRNLGYGAGVNRGLAALAPGEFVMICNPDIEVHPGAVGKLVATLESHPSWAIVGPSILTPAGASYPSARRFPSLVVAAGHAILGVLFPSNEFTRRYRTPDLPANPTAVDWVSGACFLARRSALEAIGGFDESYFMFAEDMDLCWRAGQAGWGVGFDPAAVVTHHEGVSRRHHPYGMALAHHRSALRFCARTTTGWRRALLPIAGTVLTARLLAVWAAIAVRRSRSTRSQSGGGSV
jgi:N-acetylglucosaminyl-diphospho-decaprenol L-rhamnosyltransferase